MTWTKDPVEKEISTIESNISSLSAQIANLSGVSYVDISISNNTGAQVNSGSGGVVTWTNFLGGFVIGSNNVVAVFYTYSNLVYTRLKNADTMATVGAGNYTVRCFYKSA